MIKERNSFFFIISLVSSWMRVVHAIVFAFLLLFACPLRISESEVPRKNPKKLYILEKAATDLLYPRSKSNDVHKNQNQGITR